jgi:hypothetical protein
MPIDAPVLSWASANRVYVRARLLTISSSEAPCLSDMLASIEGLKRLRLDSQYNRWLAHTLWLLALLL